MKLYFFTFIVILLCMDLSAQVVTTKPAKPTANDIITITFHADQGSKGLMNYTGDVYAHTGVITTLSTGSSDWKYVQAEWTVNIEKCKLTSIGANTYTLTISPDVYQYYGIPESETILQLALVFRNTDGSKTGKNSDGKDIFIDLDFSGSDLSVVSVEPETPGISDAPTLYFYADKGSQGLKDYEGDVYAHTGLITESSSNGTDWKNVIAEWGNNIPKAKLKRVDANTYKLDIKPSIKSYYNIQGGDNVKQLAFVFRNEDGSKTGKDIGDKNIFVDVVDLSLGIKFIEPGKNPLLISPNETVLFKVEPNKPSGMVVKINGIYKASNGGSELSFSHTFTETGIYEVEVEATAGSEKVTNSTTVYVMSEPEQKPLPDGMTDGINYYNEDDSKVTLVLFAPYKTAVHYLGEQNDFKLNDSYKMYKDGDRWWITLKELEPDREYAFQYIVDAVSRIADPYTNKILDPANDDYIPESVYPNLKIYPKGLTYGNVSVFKTGKEAYNWKVTDFVMPETDDLVIYELLIRDFDESHSIKAVEEKLEYLRQLGVNAIELMPFNEFEGNSSWGYNPSFYFATDKYYGTETAYREFIDKAHEMGFAVIMDMVLNHSFGQHPLVQLYFDKDAGQWGQPTAENPWYNQTSPNQTYSWGYDFNHESEATQQFVDRVLEYWLSEFKIDGFRYDFTKGFTNTPGDGGAYDADRIAILKRIYDTQMGINPNSVMICEHFADNREEIELSNYGMLIWGNLNHSFGQASMGFKDGADLSWGSYKARGWSKPNLITYSESHDEERQMYRNLTFGNASGSYNVKEFETAIERAKLSSLFLLSIPGPKMLWQFQELGYPYSINHCPDGSINEDCRVAEKPIRWDYAQNANRRELYNTFSQLAEIKQNYAIFSTPNFTTDVGAKAVKQISLTLDEERVIVVGNFGMSAETVQVDFNKNGWWYEYFSGDSLRVTNTGIQNFTFEAGAYEMYSTQKFDSHNWPLSNDHATELANGLRIYPNPASSLIHVDMAATGGFYQIYNQLGVEIQNGFLGETSPTVDLSQFNNGIYVLRVIKDGRAITSRFCIQH